MAVGKRKFLITFLEGKSEKAFGVNSFLFQEMQMLQTLAIEASFLPFCRLMMTMHCHLHQNLLQLGLNPITKYFQ